MKDRKEIFVPAGTWGLIVGTDLTVKPVASEDDARETIAYIISDIVYEELGGDNEFLYDEDGNQLPDEEIIDKVDDILELGAEAGICYRNNEGLWAYKAENTENPEDRLEYTILEIVSSVEGKEKEK